MTKLTASQLSTTMILTHDLYASHSLDTREELHEHLWRVECTFAGTPIHGRIIDFPILEKEVKNYFFKFQKVNLNTSQFLMDEARNFPTCETLGKSFFIEIENDVLGALRNSINPTLILESIKISLYEIDGLLYGSALTKRALSPH